MGSIEWAKCGCCGKYAYNPYALDTDEAPGGYVFMCGDCLDKLCNLGQAEKYFQELFRNHDVLSSESVITSIAECLAQQWTVRELMKQAVWNDWENWRPHRRR